MPLRFDAPRTQAWRGRHIAATLLVGAAGLLAAQHFMAGASHPQQAEAQTAPVGSASTVPTRAPWTIVYERPEHCDSGCTQVLDTLNAVSRDPASGIPDGAARVVVRDAPQPARDLIVLDPEGQPAGFISHTDDAGRIVSGLATLRATTLPSMPLASR